MTSTERSLVLGAHTWLPARLVEPFARSLRTAGFRGRLVVFAGRCGEEEKKHLRALADEVVDIDPDYPAPSASLLRLLGFVRSTRGLRRLYPAAFAAVATPGGEQASFRRWSSLEYHLEGLQSLRYLHYRRYLEALEHEPDAVLLTDLRDVFFQRDPFAEPVRVSSFISRTTRSVSAGRPSTPAGSAASTAAPSLLGSRASASRAPAPWSAHARRCSTTSRPWWTTSCAGGGRSGRTTRASTTRCCEEAASPDVTVVPNGSGRVLTLGKMPAYEVDPDGTVLNADGSVPAILHQWDRHASLVERIEAAR